MVRRGGWQSDALEMPGAAGSGTPATAPHVVVEVCRCGCAPADDGHAEHPDWALAVAWSYLTRPVEPSSLGEPQGAPEVTDDEREDDPLPDVDPASLPWWDARSRPARRRAVLPLVLLGELQAGVLLRAVYEVMRTGGGPIA
jgi:hypothetical protein